MLRAHHQGTGELLAGSTQSKQRRIELLYQYKRAKISRITVLNIQKLYLYFVYPKLYVYFEWSPQEPLKNDARATPGKSPMVQNPHYLHLKIIHIYAETSKMLQTMRSFPTNQSIQPKYDI